MLASAKKVSFECSRGSPIRKASAVIAHVAFRGMPSLLSTAAQTCDAEHEYIMCTLDLAELASLLCATSEAGPQKATRYQPFIKFQCATFRRAGSAAA